MKPLYVLIDKETGAFWKKPTGPSRYAKSKHPYAYSSLKKAETVIGQFWPKPDRSTIEIKEYVLNETK